MNKKVKTDFNSKLVLKAVKEASLEPIRKCALLVEKTAKESMKIGGGKDHEPSVAPNPPNVQSGVLRGSITTAIDPSKNTGIVGTTSVAWYGKTHEFGGLNEKHVMLPARPFMRRALEKTIKEFPKLFENLKLAETKSGKELNKKNGKGGS